MNCQQHTELPRSEALSRASHSDGLCQETFAPRLRLWTRAAGWRSLGTCTKSLCHCLLQRRVQKCILEASQPYHIKVLPVQGPAAPSVQQAGAVVQEGCLQALSTDTLHCFCHHRELLHHLGSDQVHEKGVHWNTDIGLGKQRNPQNHR